MNNTKLLESIKNLQDNFYSKSKKNILFKKSQKNNCTKIIADNISLDQLLTKTVFIVPNTNSIYIDYIIFKSYASSDNYQLIIDRFIELIITVINQFGYFELHLDLKSFSITAAERYHHVFEMYYNSCCKHGLQYEERQLSKINIYHTPSIVNMLSKLIIKYTDPSIKNKIIYYSNEDSEKQINILMGC